MQKDFIEELRKKAKTNDEISYEYNLKQEYPWISKNSVEEKFIVHTLERMFNTRGGEER